MAEVMIHHAALDEMSGAWTRHLFFDVEAQGEAWALLLRGDDKAKVGGSKTPALRWNDATGQPIPFVLATVSGEGAQQRATELAAALIGFYGAEGVPFSQRVAKLDGDGRALAFMVATIGSARPHANKESHWRVGSVADPVAAKRLAREKSDRASAVAAVKAAVDDPDKLDELASTVTGDAELEALAAIVVAQKRVMQGQ